MKRKKYFYRVVTASLALVTALGCCTSAMATTAESIKTASKINQSAGVKWSRSDARTDILAGVTQTLTEYTSQTDSGTMTAANLFKYVGIMATYMNWIVSNGSMPDGDDTIYTAFEVVEAATPVSNDSNPLTAFNAIINDAANESCVPSAIDLSKDPPTFKSKIALQDLPSFPTTLDGSYGNGTYAELITSIVQKYVDANVLMIANADSDSLKSCDSYEALVQAFGTPDDIDSVVNAAIAQHKGALKDVLDVYQAIYSQFGILANTVLKTETIGAGDNVEAKKYTAYCYVSNMSSDKVLQLSKLSQAIYNALYTVESDVSNVKTTTDSTILDDADTPFKLLTGLSLKNGEVIPPADGEYSLTDNGYRIIAAGCVYDPFNSRAGDNFFTSVVTDGMSTSDREKALNFIKRAIGYKKPLYFSEVAQGLLKGNSLDDELPTLSFTIATVGDLARYNGSSINVFAMHRGTAALSTDGSTMAYTQGEASAPADSSETGQSSATISSSATSFVGGGEDVTHPIALACGAGNTGNELSRIGALTSMMFTNIIKDSKLSEATMQSLLFVNGLGDIVTADNTIVLPAIANPCVWNYNSASSSVSYYAALVANRQAQAIEEGNGAYSDNANVDRPGLGYYPYNVAFMNHYPAIRKNSEGRLAGSSGIQSGKQFIQDGRIFFIKHTWNDTTSFSARSVGSYVETPMSYCFVDATHTVDNPNDLLPSYYCRQYHTAFSGGLKFGSGFLGVGEWADDAGYVMTKEAQGLYPLVANNSLGLASKDAVKLGSGHVTSCIRYITKQGEGDSDVSAGTMAVERFILDYLAEGLSGTQRADVFAANMKVSYEAIVADTANRFEKFLSSVLSSFLDTFGGMDGVLAMKGVYDNGVFNTVVDFIQQFYLFIIIAVVLILAKSFIKGRTNMIYVFVVLGFGVAALNVYAYVLPNIVTNLYNTITNDVSEKTSWVTFFDAVERYQDTYRDSNRKDATTGRLRPYTTTVTLYQMTDYEMSSLASELNISKRELSRGETFDVDTDAGIFVQGNRIKISLDKLFANNAIRGLTASQWADQGVTDTLPATVPEVQQEDPYSLQLENPYISLEAYYTPFCHIERSFLTNLNLFTNIFSVDHGCPRVYGEDLVKDAFVFDAFASSGIFTDPNNDDALRANIIPVTDGSTESSMLTQDALVEIAKKYFAPQEDWLNLRAIFVDPSDSVKSSLWGKSLQRQQYYDSNWEITSYGLGRFQQLIDYVNTQTKLWVIDNYRYLSTMSDENAIKATCLFATTAFSQKVSQVSQWLYPNYIDASPLTLADVLYSSCVQPETRMTSSDGDVVSGILVDMGVPGLILLFFILVLSVIFVFAITYMVPVLYGMLGAIILYRLSNSEAAAQVVSGYLKVTLTSVLSYALFSFAFRVIGYGGYQWYGFLACLIVIIICCAILFSTATAVVLDPLTLGDTTLKSALLNTANTMTRGLVSNLTANALRIRNGTFDRPVFTGMGREYRRGLSLDTMPIIGSRREGLGYRRRNLGYERGMFRRTGFGGRSARDWNRVEHRGF